MNNKESAPLILRTRAVSYSDYLRATLVVFPQRCASSRSVFYAIGRNFLLHKKEPGQSSELSKPIHLMLFSQVESV